MIYVIGDVHGCIDELRAILNELENRKISQDETVVFLGDYIDRGKDSRGVVQTVIDFKKSHPKTVTLRGNHEQMLLDAAIAWDRYEPDGEQTDDFRLWWQNGGGACAKSYGATRNTWRKSIHQTHWQFYRNTLMEYQEGCYRFVHAGFLPNGIRWYEPDRDPRLWIRNQFIYSDQDFGGVVVFGHTPQESAEPLILQNKICLDTACVFGGALTLAVLDPDAKGEARLEFDSSQAWKGS